MNKTDELKQWIVDKEPILVALTETWLHKDILDSEFVPDGYICLRSDRDASKKGGGVCLIIRNDLPVTQLRCFAAPDGQYESLWCKIKLTSRGYDVVGVVYRSPGSDGVHFFQDLDEICKTKHCLILGDFNAPKIDWADGSYNQGADHFSKQLLNKSLELNLYQHVAQPTNIADTQSSLLDLAFSSFESDVQNFKTHSPLGKSDHMMITFTWNRDVPTCITNAKRNVWRIDFSKLRTAAAVEPWNIAGNANTDSMWGHFKSTIERLVHTYAPVSRQRAHHKGPPWFDPEMRNALRKRNRAWKHYRATGEGYDFYKQTRNRCSLMKRRKRQTFEEKLSLESKTSPKRLFAYIRRRLNAPTVIPALRFGNRTAETAFEKANALAEHYASVYESSRPIDSCNLDPQGESTTYAIQPHEVLVEVLKLNVTKSPGPDNLHPLVLKNLAEFVAEPLCKIFNMSLQEGKIPRDWKQAIISPRFKGGNRNLPGNYRPISLTCIACKILERLICCKLQEHLKSARVLTPLQHGFIKGRSCITNLLFARESWAESVAKGNQVDAIFIDFSKAFDKVPHDKLLRKLNQMNIPTPLVRWIEDFLKDRTFTVRVENDSSTKYSMTSGVPQGSVLGPLLFLLFINDLPDVLKSPCLLYADDLKIWRPISSTEDVATLQEDLNQVVAWSNTWKLPINFEKSTYLCIGRTTIPNVYSMNGRNVLLSETVNDLGVLVNKDLKTRQHSEKACRSARRILGAIGRSFRHITETSFQLLYSAHVRPRLEYGGSAVYPVTCKEMSQLESVQRAATKLVQGLKEVSYEDRLEALNLFPQIYRRIRGDLIVVRRILRGELGDELKAFFPLKENVRRGHTLTVNKQRSEGLPAIYRLSRRIINVWNSLPADVAEENNESTFKTKLDSYLKNMWHREWI